MVDVFWKGNFKLRSLIETKLKGNGVIADVQEIERAREGVDILINDLIEIC